MRSDSQHTLELGWSGPLSCQGEEAGRACHVMVVEVVGRHSGMEVVGEPCRGRRVVVVEAEGEEPCPGRRVVEAEGEEPCLAAAVVVVVVVVGQASNLVLQVAGVAVVVVVVEEEGEEVGEVQTKKVPQLWSDRGMEAEEEAAAALGMWHLAAVGFPAAPGPSAWLYPLWPAVRPLPDDHHSIWRTPASG